MMKLRSEGRPDEQLLLLLIGIAEWQGEPDVGLLLGQTDDTETLDQGLCYVRLPDPHAPLAETERLAAALGRAVGAKGVPL